MKPGLLPSHPFAALLLAGFIRLAAGPGAAGPATAQPWFEIDCVDAQSGRGVPLVELETVNHLRFVTDNAGRVAFGEPGLVGREVYFHVRSHGYELPQDSFGFAGARLTPQPGARAEIRLTRRNLAERLGRLTGEGRYRDSQILGYPVPSDTDAGLVAGQDSIQAARYRGQIYWFWGDTDRLSYPLGHFRTSGATSPPPGPGAWAPATGIPLNYFTNAEGFSRPMIPLPERPDGVIWIDGLVTLPDAQGRERLVCHYSRRKDLTTQIEHGLAVFNDELARFEPATTLPEKETWRYLQGQATIVEENGARWIYCGLPLPQVRVPARWEAARDPAAYEAFTCLNAEADPAQAPPRRGDDGQIAWTWRRDAAPAGPAQEKRWLKEKRLQPAECRFLPSAGEARPEMSHGTVRWNRYRRRWILIATELGGKTSMLGEVWYAEAASPVGPFLKAVKILTHDRQSFYNPCQHEFLDEADGRVIYFEGTYVNTFSGNPDATPRYNYNQILYRLDLGNAALSAAFSP
jgi:hypothetical protein